MYPDTSFTGAENPAQPDRGEAALRFVVRAAILCAFAAMAAMAWTRNINWDEFYFLSHVHAHLDGRLDRALQTVFVHAFGWLSYIPGTEVDQITAARIVMLGFFAATCVAIHRIAKALTDRTAADIAMLAFVTSGFAIAHGGSFRADPMAASLLTCAVAVMMTTQMRATQILAVAVLSAFALLVTVKSALFLPVYMAALLWRWPDRALILRCLGAGVLALIIAAALFVWHASGITPTEGAEVSENLSEAASVTLGGSGFLPRWPEVSLWLMFSAGAVLLMTAGVFAAETHRLRIVLILFAMPLLSVLIYRNAFPYFFPFAAAPLMVAVALGARATRGGLIAKLSIVLMLAAGLMQTQRAFGEDNAAQRATIAEVHRIFPKPVPYIDQNGMISSFERLGFFMSTWGLATYRAAGQPVMADLIAQHRPPLLVANRDALHTALRPSANSAMNIGLMAEDAAQLQASYVHHAGAIWLAGQEAKLGERPATLQVPFPGYYRVETDGAASVNGAAVVDGQRLWIDASPLIIDGTSGTTLRLIWHTAASRAKPELPETGLYAGFWRL